MPVSFWQGAPWFYLLFSTELFLLTEHGNIMIEYSNSINKSADMLSVKGISMPKFKLLPGPSVRRLPLYLNLAEQAEQDGLSLISATMLADALGLDAIQVRKDISITGIAGKPKLGYKVPELITALKDFLNWNNNHNAILVGAGNLGSALLGYQGFKKHGLHFVAAFDIDESIINKTIRDIPIYNIHTMQSFIASYKLVEIAVLAVPPCAAQSCAEEIEKAGEYFQHSSSLKIMK